MRRKKYDLLAIGDASARLDMSPSNVRNYIDSGQLVCLIASDGSRLFTDEAVEEFAKWRKEKAEARRKASAI